MGKTQEPTAQGLVALAKRAARQARIDGTLERLAFLDSHFYVTTLGNHYTVAKDGIPPSANAMQVVLTPENTASESALVRALLASAVTYEAIDYGRQQRAALAGASGFGKTHASALTDLLDALLAEPVR